jgi:hypothetical protein
MKRDDDTDQDINDDEIEGESEDTRETTISSDIKEDNLDHQQQVLLPGHACRDKYLRNTRVPLPKTRSRADTVIACPLLSHSPKPPGSMAPPLLKCQKSALLNKSSKSDYAPSAQALPQSVSS